jgi:membrane-associated protein
MTGLLERVGNSVGAWLYLIAGGLAFAEAALLVGMVLPGETALLVAGYFCHEHVLVLPVMIVVAIGCAILGDSVGFELGRRYGPPLRRSRAGLRVGEQRWNQVDGFLHKHGGKAVLAARLTAVLRALVPSMAGMSRMPYRTFFAWNAIGGVIWGTSCVLLGYAFASALHRVEEYLTWAPLAILCGLGLFVIALQAYRRHRTHREAEAGAGQVR